MKGYEDVNKTEIRRLEQPALIDMLDCGKLEYVEKDKLSKIASHYGFTSQLEQLEEELVELLKACKDYKKSLRKNIIDYENLVEESADVENMIAQIKILLNASEKVKCIKLEKLDRQIGRIENGK